MKLLKKNSLIIVFLVVISLFGFGFTSSRTVQAVTPQELTELVREEAAQRQAEQQPNRTASGRAAAAGTTEPKYEHILIREWFGGRVSYRKINGVYYLRITL